MIVGASAVREGKKKKKNIYVCIYIYKQLLQSNCYLCTGYRIEYLVQNVDVFQSNVF